MAVPPDMTFRAGDVVTVEATVRCDHEAVDNNVAVLDGDDCGFFVPREAIIAVRPVVDTGDLVEHTLSGREGVVRHVHEDIAWVAWSDKNGMNTVTPVSDLIRKRTAAEMAAVAEPEPMLPVVPNAPADVAPESEENPFG